MHVGAFGFNLSVTTTLDLTGAGTTAKVDIKRPDGSMLTKELTSTDFIAPVAPATVWTVKVPIEEGDLNVAGTYQIQFTDTTPNRLLPCSIGKFNVLPNV